MKADHFSSHPQRAAISLILVIVTSLLIVTPIVHAGISELEAREAAMQSCEDQLGYAKEDQEIYDFSPRQEGGWAFGIKALESDGTMKEIIRGKLDKDGKLITLTERGGIMVSEQLQEDLARSERSYMDMYAFKQKWERRFSQLDDEQLAELNKPYNLARKALVQHDVRLPSPSDISYEEAKEKAEEAILALPGWTQEMLDHIRIKLEVYHIPVKSTRPVYQFVYSLASTVGHIEAIVAGKEFGSEYDKLKKEEDRLFGKALPFGVSVRIDAQTGELIGDIFIDTPPTKYTDLDFILWE